MLERLGHRVTLANNGREAVDLWAEHAFDLILMDMQMPVMGGIEATNLIDQLEAARGTQRAIGIYALSAAALDSEQQQGLAGARRLSDQAARSRRTARRSHHRGRRAAQSEFCLRPGKRYAWPIRRSSPSSVRISAIRRRPSCSRCGAAAAGDAQQLERLLHSCKDLAANFFADRCARRRRWPEAIAGRTPSICGSSSAN